jgi:hypothetical protein
MSAKAKKEPANQVSIKIDKISEVSGKINIAGGNITTSETNTLEQLFTSVYEKIDTRQITPTEKNDLKADVKDVEEAVKKPEVDEGFVARRLRNIGRMAPDIMEIVLATITSPAAGLGLVGQKIAERVKEK